MNLSEIKQILTEQNIQLTKSLGQNFLHDGNQLRRIVRAAELRERDKVLEIGPGLGPLTELLVQAAGQVLAIEKDARLVRILRERFLPAHQADTKQKAELRLLQDDALKYLQRETCDWADWKLVSNLPYAVASPILVELACGQSRPQRMIATLQIEVAKRLMANPESTEYGVLTLLIQLDYEPVEWFKIPAGCFFPEPDVDSACVVLARRELPLLSANQRPTFAAIVKRSFSQRRKMMAKLLKTDWGASTLDQAFAGVPLAPQIRAEAVSLDQFVALTRFLHERRNLRCCQ
jgi:16S rRNA (adenine1518-N6/adenine1519-N6)-dimethyltransferase